MKVVVTLEEVRQQGRWELFCQEQGFDIWCIEQGASPQYECTLTVEQALDYGFSFKSCENHDIDYDG